MSKKIWSVKELMANDFGATFIKEKMGRDLTNLSDTDYLILDNKGFFHIHNIQSQGSVSSDNFESSNYEDIESEEEEQAHNLYNQQQAKYNNKFVKKVEDFIHYKGHKAVKEELKKYLKRYYKWEDSKINSFLRKLKTKTTKIYNKLDNINVKRRFKEKVLDLFDKHTRMIETDTFKSNFAKFLKKDFSNKTFNSLLKSALKDTIGDISVEDLIFDLLLAF